MSSFFFQGYEGVRGSLDSKKNSALTVKSIDSNMNKKSKKKKEEEIELPSKKTLQRDSCPHLRQYERVDLRGIYSQFAALILLCSSCAVIPYHITICTGLERDASTTSRAYVIIVGANHTQTERLWLDLADGRRGFQAGSLECFESRGSDVGEIKKVEVRGWLGLVLRVQQGLDTHMLKYIHIHTHTHTASKCPSHCLQLGHDGATPESCWLVDELSVAVPTKGVKYVFACKCWLAKDRGDGLTARVFNTLDAEAVSISRKVHKFQAV